MIPFLIFGAGGHAKAVINAAIESGEIPSAVIDDHPSTSRILGIPVFQTSEFEFPKEFRFIVAIGGCVVRRDKFERLKSLGGVPQTVIHPFSSVSRFSTVGPGSVILHGAVVDPSVSIGENVIVNDSAVIGHDSIVGNHVHVSANSAVGGGVAIGSLAWIGLGSSVREGIQIGEGAFIGLGAMVSHDVPAHHKAISPHRRDAIISPIHA